MALAPTPPGPIREAPRQAAPRATNLRQPVVPHWMLLLFFLSGFAALVYQVAWQRSLFAIFGVNIESVTLVVTVFMLGLGLGSLAGGALSRHPKRRLVLWFASIELAIGLYGAVSLDLFAWIGEATLAATSLITGFATFLLLLPPTLMMGSTLPLLVTFAVRRSGQVGPSVGLLYFVNTLGSAAAAFATVLVLMRTLGLQRSVLTAAAINGTVALIAFAWHVRARAKP
jgi:spermidine synthase